MLTRPTKLTAIIVVGIMCFALPGCSYKKVSNLMGVHNSSGYYFYPSMVKKLKVGTTTKGEALKLLGSPSFKSFVAVNTWYYVYQKTWYIAIFSEHVVDQQILTLKFNQKNILTYLGTKGTEDCKAMPLKTQTTRFDIEFTKARPELLHLKSNPQAR